MKDLEIRGAGNMLGGEQSGHIADVGFDLYIRLVGEAVAEFRGDDTEPEAEVRIELPIDAHLPTDYVESERLRLEMYKRLAEVRSRGRRQGRRGRAARPLRPAAGRGAATCSRWPGSGCWPAPAGLTEIVGAGQLHPLRAGRAARVATAAAEAAVPGSGDQGRRPSMSWCRGRRRHHRWPAGGGHRAAALVRQGDRGRPAGVGRRVLGVRPAGQHRVRSLRRPLSTWKAPCVSPSRPAGVPGSRPSRCCSASPSPAAVRPARARSPTSTAPRSPSSSWTRRWPASARPWTRARQVSPQAVANAMIHGLIAEHLAAQEGDRHHRRPA